MSIPSTKVAKLSGGSEVEVADSVFEEFLISRCGERLLPDERAALGYADEIERKDNLIGKVAIRLIKEKIEKWEICGRASLFEAQVQSQLK